MDEHPWIEKFCRTLSYASFRQGVRDYYRNYYPLSTAARSDAFLNPGACWVRAIGFEPRVGMAVLGQMLLPHYTAGRVKVLQNFKPDRKSTRLQSSPHCDNDKPTYT